MRAQRGDRRIASIADETGIARGWISMYERGQAIPTAKQIPTLERVYGPASGWYPAGVLAVLLPDLALCEGCGSELPADSSRRRLYHDSACASRARRRRLRLRSQAESGIVPDSTTTGAEAPESRSLE